MKQKLLFSVLLVIVLAVPSSKAYASATVPDTVPNADFDRWSTVPTISVMGLTVMNSFSVPSDWCYPTYFVDALPYMGMNIPVNMNVPVVKCAQYSSSAVQLTTFKESELVANATVLNMLRAKYPQLIDTVVPSLLFSAGVSPKTQAIMASVSTLLGGNRQAALQAIASLNQSGFENLFTGGLPFSNRTLLSVTGTYKFSSTNAADRGGVMLVATRWNTATNHREIVGGAYNIHLTATGSYLPFAAQYQSMHDMDPILFPDSTAVPDTFCVVFASSAAYSNITLGSELVVDDVHINFMPVPDTFDVVIRSADTLRGTVTGSGRFVEGSTDTITATATDGYVFTHWSDGDLHSTRYITVDSNIELTAYFEEPISVCVLGRRIGGMEGVLNSPEIAHLGSINVPVDSAIDVSFNDSCSGGNLYCWLGQSLTMTALPAHGYHFVDWTLMIDSVVVSHTSGPVFNAVVDSAWVKNPLELHPRVSIYANFAPDSFNIVLKPAGEHSYSQVFVSYNLEGYENGGRFPYGAILDMYSISDSSNHPISWYSGLSAACMLSSVDACGTVYIDHRSYPCHDMPLFDYNYDSVAADAEKLGAYFSLHAFDHFILIQDTVIVAQYHSQTKLTFASNHDIDDIVVGHRAIHFGDNRCDVNSAIFNYEGWGGADTIPIIIHPTPNSSIAGIHVSVRVTEGQGNARFLNGSSHIYYHYSDAWLFFLETDSLFSGDWTIDVDIEYYYPYDPPYCHVSVSTPDTNMGTVSGGGGGYGSCGDSTTLAATPKLGYRFLRWNDSVTLNPRTVVFFGVATYIAYFEVDPDFDTCTIVDEGLPYLEDFDTYTDTSARYTGLLPDCWRIVKRDVPMSAVQQPQIMNRQLMASSGDYSLYMYSRCLLAMPPVLADVNTLKMTLSMKKTNAADKLVVGILSDYGSDSSFVPVDTLDKPTTAMTTYTVDLAHYTGNGHYIAFRNISGSSPESRYAPINIDDISLVPECSIINLEDLPYAEDFESYTDTTARYTGVVPDCWNLVQKDVRMSASQEPMIVKRDFASIEGQYSFYFYSRSLYAMPRVGFDISRLTLSMDMLADTNSGLIVGVLDDPEEPESFVPVDTLVNATSRMTGHTVDFSSYAGRGLYVGFRNITFVGDDYRYAPVYIDNLLLDTLAADTAAGDTTNVNPAPAKGGRGHGAVAQAELKVYPNPTTGKVTIESSSAIVRADLYDFAGRVVLSAIETSEIDLSRFATGVYTLRVVSDQGVEIRRIVKK